MKIHQELEYAGFWCRTWASLLDGIIIMVITAPPLMMVYGTRYFTESHGLIAGWVDFWLSWVFPAVFTVAFWNSLLATPGKRAISARIVDARTGVKPTMKQWLIRYGAYFLSALPICLGFVWVGIDRRKQGWHDMLAGTVVVRDKHRGPKPVAFEEGEQSLPPVSGTRGTPAAYAPGAPGIPER